MIGDLGPILDHVPAWLLVLFRLSGIFLLAPVLSSLNIPGQLKVFLVLGLSFCVYPILLADGRPSAAFLGQVIDGGLALWPMVAMVAIELLIGYAIGYAASLPLLGMQIGGHVIDQQVGLGIAGVFNPDTQEQSGPVGELLYTLALAVFTILGGHQVILATLVGSFDHIPPGGFGGFDALVGFMLGIVTVMFELSLRIAAPLLCLVFLETLAMGFVSRTVPGLNILSLGFSLRILMGLAFLVGSVGLTITVYTETTRRLLAELAAFFMG